MNNSPYLLSDYNNILGKQGMVIKKQKKQAVFFEKLWIVHK